MNCREEAITYKKSPSEFLLPSFKNINHDLIKNVMVLSETMFLYLELDERSCLSKHFSAFLCKCSCCEELGELCEET